MQSKTKSNTYPVDEIQSKTKFDTYPADKIQTLKPKSNTNPNDKFNKITQLNNKKRTKNSPFDKFNLEKETKANFSTYLVRLVTDPSQNVKPRYPQHKTNRVEAVVMVRRGGERECE